MFLTWLHTYRSDSVEKLWYRMQCEQAVAPIHRIKKNVHRCVIASRICERALNLRTSIARTVGITVSRSPIHLSRATRWIRVICDHSEVKIGLIDTKQAEIFLWSYSVFHFCVILFNLIINLLFFPQKVLCFLVSGYALFMHLTSLSFWSLELLSSGNLYISRHVPKI